MLTQRMLKAAMRVQQTRYRVVAAGIDHKGRIVAIATCTPRLSNRGWHAEERVIRRCTKGLRKILIARYGARGERLPIDPCEKCERLARKLGIEIERAR